MSDPPRFIPPLPPRRAPSPSAASTRAPSPARHSFAPPRQYAERQPPPPDFCPQETAGRRGSLSAYSASGSWSRPSGGLATSYYSSPVAQQPPPQPRAVQTAAGVDQRRPSPAPRRLSLVSTHQLHQSPARPPSPLAPRVQHYPSPPLTATRRPSDGFSDVDMSDRRRPKTPPDCCSVCGSTETPEWRKGPAGNRSLCNGCGLLAAKRAKERDAQGYAHPSTIDEIERELEGIGVERFKSPTGRYALPQGTRNRILVTQERTRAQNAQQGPTVSQGTQGRRKSRGGLDKAEKAAAGALVGMARRASLSAGNTGNHVYSSAMAPRSPPSSTRGRRSGSLLGESSNRASNSGTHGTGLPPSTSYMLPPGGAGPSSSFSFGRPSSYTPARPPSPSSSVMLPPINPSLVHAPSPAFRAPSGLVRPASPGFARTPSPGLVRPMSALTTSTNRMSIAHLTSQRPPSPPVRLTAAVSDVRLPSIPTATSALRRSSSVGPSSSRSSSMTRRPTS